MKIMMNRMLCLLSFCLLAAVAQAQVSIVTGDSATAAPLCSSAFPIQFFTSSNTVVPLSYTATITDSGSTTISPVSGPTPGFAVINTAWDLTSLIPGPATVTISDTVTTKSYPLTLYVCAPSTGLKIVIYSPLNRIAPNPASSLGTPLVVSVYNDDIVSIPAATVSLSGVVTAWGTVTSLPPPPRPGTVIGTVTGWTWTPSGGSLAPGDVISFPFTLKGTVPGIGQSFTLTAGFIPNSGPYGATDSKLLNVVGALDPNDKSGPTGIGAAHYIKGNAALPYQIAFENDPGASAPAQNVVVTDQLDPAKVDLTTFRFGPITFGPKLVTPPIGVNPFSVTVFYDVDGNPVTTTDDVLVKIDGALDVNISSPTYGQVTWTFQSLDPLTGLPPLDPMVGFLPPDTSGNIGVGTVAFNVWPQSSLVTDDAITNSASIVFDANPPINTSTWTNTILKIIPALTIKPAAGQVKVTWPSWTLQEASAVTGPWSDSAVQVSPWTLPPTGTMKFFRLRSP